MAPSGTLIFGYGNPGRQDDGLGPAMADRVGELGLPGVVVDSDYQLNVEEGAALARYLRVVFVDASKTAAAPFTFERVAPATEVTFTSHSVSPESVLAIAAEHFGRAPEAWVLGIRGYAFEFAEGLTEQALGNFDKAFSFIRSWIGTRKE
ncbi:MAG: hydrogenase maturation protease [Candidatus Hydrogenedentes bacterium]|nr:hydrogenase maturation protease [Candidatus Hydrogenedentota bacterium]